MQDWLALQGCATGIRPSFFVFSIFKNWKTLKNPLFCVFSCFFVFFCHARQNQTENWPVFVHFEKKHVFFAFFKNRKKKWLVFPITFTTKKARTFEPKENTLLSDRALGSPKNLPVRAGSVFSVLFLVFSGGRGREILKN